MFFTPVCDSVHRVGVSTSLHAGIHPVTGRRRHTLPTGMHTCLNMISWMEQI